MKTMIILNPKAAKGRAAKYFPKIFALLDKVNLDYECAYTEAPLHAESIAKKAVESGYSRIVSAGGDGTLNEVINGILKADGDPDLAILPIGTCNDFIKAIAIPKDITRACEVITTGTAKRCDVFLVGDRYSINAAGVGFDVAVVHGLKQSKVLRGFAMYLATVLRNAFSYQGMNLTIVNGVTHFERKALMLTVANGVSYGGNFKIAPAADASDGYLNAVLLKDMSPLKRLLALPRFFNGSHVKLPETEMFLTNELKIIAEAPLTVQIEGELLEWPSNEITMSVLPQRLKVLVPKIGN
jgi:diacylglycerol kinase (ATP)